MRPGTLDAEVAMMKSAPTVDSRRAAQDAASGRRVRGEAPASASIPTGESDIAGDALAGTAEQP